VKVLADTSVWRMALRRKGPYDITKQLMDLIESSSVVMIGQVRQEILSGLIHEDMYFRLKESLFAFNDFITTTHDYETAARYYNVCRKHDAYGSYTDFFVCAVANNNNLPVFTVNKELERIAQYISVEIYRPSFKADQMVIPNITRRHGFF
jgi:hypothetical protein